MATPARAEVVPEPVDWYDVPLYYEVAFQSLTVRESAFLDEIYRAYAPRGRRRVLEPACGAGRLVVPLAARGYRVTGFDRNEHMLAFAREQLAGHGLRARLHRADLADFAVGGPFEAAWCTVNSFRYLLSETAARAHLRAVARVLVPGGIYALGLHLSEYSDRRASREQWRDVRDGVDVRCVVTSQPPDRRHRTESLRSTLSVRERGSERRYRSQWSFRTYSGAQLQGLLATVPAFEHVATYDFDYDAERPVELDADRLDAVLVLRRR